MPEGFKFLLERILKPAIAEAELKNPDNPIIHRDIRPFLQHINSTNLKIITEAGELNSGVPQGGIVSPLLLN